MLAERATDPVTRQEFNDEVWAGLIVTDDALTRAISELRKLFGDRIRPFRVIETVPRVGYRLVVPVHPVELAGETTEDSAPPVEEPEGMSKRLWRWGASLGVGLLLLGAGYALSHQRPSGTDPLRVTPVSSAPGFEMAPALSPDGRRLAFIHGDDEVHQLVVADSDGEGWIRLTGDSSRTWSPTWSPDGSTLAFIAYEESDCSIQTVPALGGPFTSVGTCPATGNTEIDWSPDGRRIARSTDRGLEAGQIRMLDVQTGRVAALAYDWHPEVTDWGPRFSPNSARLLITRSELGNEATLAVIDLEQGHVQQVETPAGKVVGYDWIDESRAIVSILGEQASLWMVSVDGTRAPTWLPTAAPWTFRLTTSNGLIIAEKWGAQASIVRSSTDHLVEQEALAPSTAYEFFPAWAPTGEQIAFLSDRSGTLHLWTASVNGDRAQQVTQDGAQLSPPRWSSSGRLAFVARVENETDVFVVDTEGASPRRLALRGSNELHPNWSPDGNWLYVWSDRDGGDIWRVPVGGGEPQRVTDDGSVIARLSPDGRWLYVVRPESSELWRRPLHHEGAEEMVAEDVYDRTVPYRPHLWVPYDGGVYVADRQPGGGYNLVAISTEGEQRRIGRLTDGAISGFDVAPNGEDLLVGTVSGRSADLLRIDLSD
ncbi:MAG: hypothetical protein Rubg2KO_10930 [Rubricoccaceae bacterium]